MTSTLPSTPPRAWFAFTEDLVLQWTAEPSMARDELLELLADVLTRLPSPR